MVSSGQKIALIMRPIVLVHGVELWLGVGKILAPFRETVKI
jgi:hypothetical protein